MLYRLPIVLYSPPPVLYETLNLYIKYSCDSNKMQGIASLLSTALGRAGRGGSRLLKGGVPLWDMVNAASVNLHTVYI